MSTISVSLPSDGSTADVSDYNTPINTIVDAINGGLDNSNIASGAAIATSKLADDAGITTAKIAAGAVTQAKLDTAAGGIGAAWQSWTPTWTNVSGGTLNYAKYVQIGKTVYFRIKYTLAGAGVSGGVIFSAPVALNADYALETPLAGSGSFIDTGTQLYPAILMANSASAILMRPLNAAGTNATGAANTSSTNPFTFGSTDVIWAAGSFEAA